MRDLPGHAALGRPIPSETAQPAGCVVCVRACMLRGTFSDHSLGLLGLPAPRWATGSRRAARAPSLLLLSPHLSSAWGMPTRTGGKRGMGARGRGKKGRASWSGLAPHHDLPSIPRLCPKVVRGSPGRPLREAGLLRLRRFRSPSVVFLDPRISGTCA